MCLQKNRDSILEDDIGFILMPDIMSEILMLLLESSVLHLEICSKVSLLFLSMACSYQSRKLFCWISMSRSPWNASACGVIVGSLDSGWLAIFKNILTWSSVLKFPLSKWGSRRSAQLTGWIFSSSVWQFFLSFWPSCDCYGFLDCCISSASPANFLDKMMKSVLPLFALSIKLVLLEDQKLSSSIWFLDRKWGCSI